MKRSSLWTRVSEVTPLADGQRCGAWTLVFGGTTVAAALEPQWGWNWLGRRPRMAHHASSFDPALVRNAAAAAGGHATLARADTTLRARISARHPEPPAVAALSKRVRAFDPSGVLDSKRLD